MNALLIGCLIVTALCWIGVLVLIGPVATLALWGMPTERVWNERKEHIWALLVVGALFGCCGLALGVLG